MFDKATPPPPPDYSSIAAASKESAQIAAQTQKDNLDWAKQQYADNKGTTDKVVDSFLTTQDTNAANAAKDRARYEGTFQPLEDSLAKDADSYASSDRKDLERGRATANVAQQFDGARQSATRDLEAFGVNPASTRFAALDLGFRTQKAAASAAAANQSDQVVDATGRALRSEAINVGRGYPGQIAGTYGTSLQAGSGAVNADLSTTASGSNTMGTPTQWAGVGNQALGTAVNAQNTGYQNTLAYTNASNANAQGYGQVAGLIGGVAAKSYFSAEGGAIPGSDATTGGAVPVGASPTHGVGVDDVPAQLTAGEFVLPKDVTSWLGEEKLQKMILKSRQDKQSAGAKPQVGRAAVQTPAFQSRPQMRQALPVG